MHLTLTIASPSPSPININVSVSIPPITVAPDTALDTYTGVLAIATIVLALFTVLLAVIGWRALRWQRREIKHTEDQLKLTNDQLELTRDEVAASRDQAQATRDALAVTVQPLLTSVPAQMFLRDDQLYEVEFADGWGERLRDLGDILVPRRPDHGAYCSVPLRNVGSGVAFLTSNSISDGGGGASWNGKMSNAIVPVGELTRLTYTVPLDRPELTELRNGLLNGQPHPEVDVSYVDLHGRRFRTKLFLQWTGVIWYVRQVYVYRDAEEEPFATTGPSDP